MLGTLTISIDTELAWGNWDDLTDTKLREVEKLERPIIRRLVALFDRHEVPATWAIVAALLDPASAKGRPGREEHWYAPDMVETVMAARTSHDLGSHSGRHVYFDRTDEAELRDDLAFAVETHRRHGSTPVSFIFPRNYVARTDLLDEAGFKVFRSEDWAWHQRIRGRNRLAGRAANLVDKILPFAPEAVRPVRVGPLTDLAGSTLFLGRNGIRRLASRQSVAAKLRKGLDRAEREQGVFHLWFHPSNFYHRMEEQFAVFEELLKDVAARRDSGRMDIRTMASFA